jgi:hypothetical protein
VKSPPPRICLALLVCLAALLTAWYAGPAWATAGFAYRWKSPHVSVMWREGNESPEMPALRRQVGHWKRLAESLWSKESGAAPLDVQVSFYGPEMGSEGPVIKLKSGSRSAEIKPPFEEAEIVKKLVEVRGGATTAAAPPDDAEPRISPDGFWVASIRWHGGDPEVWITKRNGDTVTRVPFVGGRDLLDRLILTAPTWSPDGHQVAWIQGHRVVIFSTLQRAARYVTPAGKDPVEVLWPPREGGPMLVRYSDESFDFLDGVSGSIIPVSSLLKKAAPMGRFFWSPTGQRLLFRTQSRIEVAALTLPGKAANLWDRFLNKALGGPPPPPEPKEGDETERLAVLDLRARRLDAYPLDGTPLDLTEITSVSWSPDEQTIFAVGSLEPRGAKLVRFPLRHDSKPDEVLSDPGRVVTLGWRSTQMTTDKLPDPRFAQYALLKEDAVFPSQSGTDFASAYPDGGLVQLEVQPGPQGGYLGVEGEEEETQSEPRQVIFLENMDHAGGEEIRRDFPGGYLVTYTLDGPLVPRIRSFVADRKPVDLDVIWERGQSIAVGMLSEGGGVGTLVGVAPHPTIRGQVVDVSLSELMTRANGIVAANPYDSPFQLTDASTGTSTLSLRYAHFDAGKLLLYSVVVLGLFFLLVFVLRKKMAR